MDINKILRHYRYFFQFDDLNAFQLIMKFIFFIPLLLIYTVFALVGSTLYYVFTILMTPAVLAYTSFRKQSKKHKKASRIFIQILLAIFGIIFTPFLLVGLVAGLISMILELLMLVIIRLLMTKEMKEEEANLLEEDPLENYTKLFKGQSEE